MDRDRRRDRSEDAHDRARRRRREPVADGRDQHRRLVQGGLARGQGDRDRIRRGDPLRRQAARRHLLVQFGSGRLHHLDLLCRGPARLDRRAQRADCAASENVDAGRAANAGERWRNIRSNAPPSSRTAMRRWVRTGMLGPHVYRDSSGSYLSWVGSTPLADEELLEHAGDIVRAEGMGQDDVPDYLNLAIGSTDSVGHEYGPVSLEQLDTVLRLDRALGARSSTISTGPSARAATRSRSAPTMAWPTRPRSIASTASPAPRSRRCSTGSRPWRRLARATTHRSRPAIIAELQKAPFIGEVYTAERLAHAAPERLEGAADEALFPAGANPELPVVEQQAAGIPPGALRDLRPVQAGHDLRLCARGPWIALCL